VNTFKRIYRWILISIISQVLVLLLINNVVLVKLSNAAKSAKITEFEEKKVSKKAITVQIPDNVENVKVSFDGSYVSYVVNGKIEVMSVDKKNVVNIIGKDNTELTYYNWLPDKNMIIYAYKTNNYTRVGITTYDVDNEIEHDYPAITKNTSLPSGSEVVDIQLSAKTNVTYVKVKISDTQAKVVRYDIHEEIYYIMTTDINTDMRKIHLFDYLAYKNPYENKIVFRQGLSGASHSLTFDANIDLVDGDSEYSVYVGEYDANGNVYKLYKGSYEDKSLESWQQIVLQKPVPYQNIFVVGTSVYIYVESEKAVYNVGTGNKTSVDGQLFDVIERYAVTLDGNKVKIIPLKS